MQSGPYLSGHGVNQNSATCPCEIYLSEFTTGIIPIWWINWNSQIGFLIRNLMARWRRLYATSNCMLLYIHSAALWIVLTVHRNAQCIVNRDSKSRTFSYYIFHYFLRRRFPEYLTEVKVFILNYQDNT